MRWFSEFVFRWFHDRAMLWVCAVEVLSPIVHEPPPLEQVRRRVGRLDPVADDVSKRAPPRPSHARGPSPGRRIAEAGSEAVRHGAIFWFFRSPDSAMSCNRLPPTLGNKSGCRGRRASAPRPGCPEHAGEAAPGPSRTPRGGRRPPRRRAVHQGTAWLCWATCGPLYLAPRRRRHQELERQLHELGRVRRPHRRDRRRHVPMRQRACDSRPRSACRAPGRLDLHGPDRHQDLQHVGTGHLGDGSADVREGRGVRGCSARVRAWRALRQAARFCSTTRAAAAARVGRPPGAAFSHRPHRRPASDRTNDNYKRDAIDAERWRVWSGWVVRRRPDGGGLRVHELVAVVRRHRLERLQGNLVGH